MVTTTVKEGTRIEVVRSQYLHLVIKELNELRLVSQTSFHYFLSTRLLWSFAVTRVRTHTITHSLTYFIYLFIYLQCKARSGVRSAECSELLIESEVQSAESPSDVAPKSRRRRLQADANLGQGLYIYDIYIYIDVCTAFNNCADVTY